MVKIRRRKPAERTVTMRMQPSTQLLKKSGMTAWTKIAMARMILIKTEMDISRPKPTAGTIATTPTRRPIQGQSGGVKTATFWVKTTIVVPLSHRKMSP